jgi:hypothetical protein
MEVVLEETAQIATERFANHFAQLAEYLRRALSEAFQQSRQIWSEIDARLRRMEPAAYHMGSLGWTVPLWGPLFLAEDIMEQGVPDSLLDEAFEGEYAANRRRLEKEMLERIGPAKMIRRWEPLLTEVILAYRRKHYRIAVPALLVVFEGAVVLAPENSSANRNLQIILQEKHSVADFSWQRVAWASLSVFVSMVFRDHRFSYAPPKRLNRHWFLHGRDEPRWMKVDCLRLFQAIDTLIAVGSAD